jgi:hypothetical protein
MDEKKEICTGDLAKHPVDTPKGVSLTPTLTSFLKPTADYLGIELRDYVKVKIENLKAKKRKANVQSHMNVVGVQLGIPLNYDEQSLDNIQQLELFDEWVEGAQEIDPNDEVLAKLWQGLLREIVQGKSKNKVLIKTLKSLDSHEAKLLLEFKGRAIYHPKGSEERFILRKLKSLDLIEFNWPLLAMLAISYAMAIAIFTTVPGISKPFETTFSLVQLGLLSLIPAAAMVAIIPKYRLSWLGKRLLEFCPNY